MDFVITLIADSQRLRLPQIFVDTTVQLLSMQDVDVTRVEWLKPGVAVDLYAQHSELGTLDSLLQTAIRGHAFDAIVQPAPKRRYKLLAADMESTVITCECLDELAEYAGLKDKIAGITARAMNGELDFETALKERVGLLAGLPESTLQEVFDKNVRPMPGAKSLVSAMKRNGAYTLLVSGGFDFYTERVKQMLGFDEARGNRLEIVDGKLTGNVIPPILGKEAKLAALLETCDRLRIEPGEVLAIGDGANDLPMLLAAGLGVAYHAKPVVRAQTHARLNHCDLSVLAEFVVAR